MVVASRDRRETVIVEGIFLGTARSQLPTLIPKHIVSYHQTAVTDGFRNQLSVSPRLESGESRDGSRSHALSNSCPAPAQDLATAFSGTVCFFGTVQAVDFHAAIVYTALLRSALVSHIAFSRSRYPRPLTRTAGGHSFVDSEYIRVEYRP